MPPHANPLLFSTEAVSDGRLLERSLPSGRALTLRTDADGEEIEIRSKRGEVELRIVLTDAGPVVTMRGARLVVDSPDVAFRCRNFEVQATETLSLRSDREILIQADELRAQTQGDIHLNGAYVRLNCTPDAQVPLPLPELDAAAPQSDSAACCAHDHAVDSDPHQP